MKFEVLPRPEFAVFTTREFAIETGVAMASATRQLSHAAERGALVRITRGVWASPTNPAFHPLVCVPKILGREQGHVSFLTALHTRGVISQIPRTIQVATTGHGRKLVTPVGTFELFRLAPKLMRAGIVWSETRVPYRIATAEKALLDTLYISTKRGGRFRSLPELDLTRFSRRRFRSLLAQLEDRRAITAIERRFLALVP